MHRKKSILIAGPWVNEFGWELMVWQPAVRYKRMRDKYEKCYVITFKNHKYLYEDCEVFDHQQQLMDAKFGFTLPSLEMINDLVKKCIAHFNISEPYDLFSPRQYVSFKSRIKRALKIRDTLHRNFFVSDTNLEDFDIGFHFRSFERAGDIKGKSFPPDKADQLVSMCLNSHYKVCCIGAPGYSYVPKGAINRQSEDLEISIRYMSKCRLIVGGSSAPMHLASLCHLPIVIWTGPPFDASRYFKSWNPFNAKVFLVTEQNFNPEINDIYACIENAMLNIKAGVSAHTLLKTG